VVSIGLIMHIKSMRTLKMVNIDANVDNGNTQVHVVISLKFELLYGLLHFQLEKCKYICMVSVLLHYVLIKCLI
jgi:hypothetical protein